MFSIFSRSFPNIFALISFRNSEIQFLYHDFRQLALNRLPAHMTHCLMDMLLGIPKPPVSSWKLISSTLPFQTRTYLPLLHTPVWSAAAQAPWVLASPSFSHTLKASRKQKSVHCLKLIPKLPPLKHEKYFNHYSHSCKHHIHHTFTSRSSAFQGGHIRWGSPQQVFISDAVPERIFCF